MNQEIKIGYGNEDSFELIKMTHDGIARIPSGINEEKKESEQQTDINDN